MEKNIWKSDELWREVSVRLRRLYVPSEAKQIAFLVLEHLYGCSRNDLVMQREVSLESEALEAVLRRLSAGEPLQYVLGKAYFEGMAFEVSPATLIPRPETAELVHWVAEDGLEEGPLLDVGTGSGCIAIALAQHFEGHPVHAVDVSEAALAVARRNAEALGAEVQFHCLDILREGFPARPLEVVVSNPPYVRELEKAQMSPSVWQHEPSSALFVPDDDPLRFYRRIGALAMQDLVPGGRLYFEINEAFGKETVRLLQGMGFFHVSLRQDLQGKDRMVRAVK